MLFLFLLLTVGWTAAVAVVSTDLAGTFDSWLAAMIKSAGLPTYKMPEQQNITEWTAVGDSFTAGVGSNGDADFIIDSGSCLRYQQSWPMIVNRDTRWPGDSANRKLNLGACTGDLAIDVVENQVTDRYRYLIA
jgi:hypothetical protein